MDFNTGNDGSKDMRGTFDAWKAGVLGAFFQLKTHEATGSQRMFYVSVLVMTAQLCYLPLSQGAGFEWPAAFVQDVEPILQPFAFGFITFPSATAFLLLFGIAVLMTVGMIVGMGLLAYDETRPSQPAGFGNLASPLYFVFRLNQTVLQVPCTALLMRVATGEFPIEVPAAAVTVVSTVSGILLVCHVSMTSIFALCVIENLPFRAMGMNKTLYAAPHGRVEMAASLVRSCITALYVALAGSSTQSSKNALVALSVVSGLVLVGIYVHWLPWFNQDWNRFSIGCYSIFLWTSICAVVAQAVGDSGDSSALLLFGVSLVFFVISVLSLAQSRTSAIKASKISKLLSSPYLVELHLRLRHLTLKHGEAFEFKDEAEAEFREAAELLPGSPFINLTVAGIVIATSRKVIFSLNLLRQARQNPLAFDLEFMLFYHNKLNQQKQTNSQSEVTFLEADAQVAQARTALIETLKCTGQFWKQVARRSFTVRSLLEHGAKVHAQALQVRQSLAKLTKLKAMNKEAVQVQAMYYQYVMNDKDTAYKLLSKSSGDTSSDKGSSAAVCTISGDNATLGQILDLSKGMTAMFGFSKSDLVGNNVNMLCPAPFQAVHDMFLQQFMAMDNDFVSQARRVFGMHQQGHIMVLDLDITPSINMAGELILAAKFSKVAQNSSTHLVLVDELTGTVTGMSQHAPELLGVDEHEVYTLNIKVGNLIPRFGKLSPGEEHTNVHLATMADQPFKYVSRRVEYKSKPASPVTFHIKVLLIWLTPQDHNMTIQAQMEALQQQEDSDDDECGGSDCDRAAAAAEPNQDGTDTVVGDRPLHASLKLRVPPALEGEAATSASWKVDKRGTGRSPTLPTSSGPLRSPRRNVRAHLNDDLDARSTGSKRSKGQKSTGMGTAGFTDASSVNTDMNGSMNNMSIRQIQRRIARNLQRRDPKLMSFVRFGKRFMLFFFLFGLANATLMVLYFDQLREDVTMSRSSIMTIHGFSIINVLVLFEHNPLAWGANNERRFAGSQALLRTQAEDMKALHGLTAAFADADESMNELFHDPGLQVTLDAAEYRDVSYHVALLEFIGHAENYLNQDNGACLDSCHFILNNAHYDLFENALRVARFFEHYAHDKLAEIEMLDVGTIIVVLVLLMLSFVQGYLPMFANNNNQRNRVGKAFLAIPARVAQKLQSRTNKRLWLVQNGGANWFSQDQEDLDFDEGNSDDDEGNPGWHGSVARASSPKTSSARRGSRLGKLGGAEVAPEPSPGSGKFMAAGGGQAPAGQSTRTVGGPGPAGRRGRCNVLGGESCPDVGKRCVYNAFQAMQLGVTFWLVLGYFLTTAFLNEKHRANVAEEDAAVFVSGLRYVLSSALLYWAALPVEIAPWERRTVTSHLDAWESTLDKVLAYDRSLKYGNATLGLSAFQKTEGDLFTLNFEDACDAHCQDYITRSGGNMTAVHGLKHGLNLALERSFELFTLGLRAQRALMSDPTNATLRAEVETVKEGVYKLEEQLILQGQLKRAVDLDLAVLEAEMYSIRIEKIVASCILALLLLLGQILSTRTFHRMDKDLKKSQTLLLVLPVQVFHSVPEIVKLLSD